MASVGTSGALAGVMKGGRRTRRHRRASHRARRHRRATHRRSHRK